MKNLNKDEESFIERIFSALTLIIIGIVLFLNTSSLLPWSVWLEFISFWPFFIISAGLGLILSFNKVAEIIGKLIGFLIFVFLIFAAAVNTGAPIVSGFETILPKFNWFNFSSNNGNYDSTYYEEISNKVNYESLSLNSEIGFGYYEFNGFISDNSILLANSVFNSQNTMPFSLEERSESNNLFLEFKSKHKSNITNINSNPKYYLSLDNKINIEDLNFKFGAGESLININNELKVKNINVDTGAGKTILKLNSDSTVENININIGAGDFELIIPKGLEYKLVYNVGIGSLNIEGEKEIGGLGNKGEFKTENYAKEKSVLLTVNVGIGKLDLKFN